MTPKPDDEVYRMDEKLRAQADQTFNTADAALEEIDALEGMLKDRREAILRRLRTLHAESGSSLNEDDLKDFLKEPYVVIPVTETQARKGKPTQAAHVSEIVVAAPRFVPFFVGTLERSTPTYNIFRVRQFDRYLGEWDEGLDQYFPTRPLLDARVADGRLTVADQAQQEEAWSRYREHFSQREGTTTLRVKPGAEFRLIADLVRDGILPFTPTPVRKEHLRPPEWNQGKAIALRDYQQEAWETWLNTGAAGIFWMPSAGKSFFGIHLLAHITGKKIIVVHTKAQREMWEERIREHLTWKARNEVEVITYHGWENLVKRMKRKDWVRPVFVGFDECHHLPSRMFSRFATLDATYRMGWSASPHREDGNEYLIAALTGVPIGQNWKRMFEQGVVVKPDFHLHRVPDVEGKLRTIEELMKKQMKTIIFSDGLEFGQRIAQRLGGLPTVDGSTREQLASIRKGLRDRPAVVVSRVGDAGLDFPDLRRIIEADFLYGSRMQQIQRLGRLMHGDEAGEHHILMTPDEEAKYGKRLLAVREKGFRIAVHQHK